MKLTGGRPEIVCGLDELQADGLRGFLDDGVVALCRITACPVKPEDDEGLCRTLQRRR
jgi:hypothetical protein